VLHEGGGGSMIVVVVPLDAGRAALYYERALALAPSAAARIPAQLALARLRAAEMLDARLRAWTGVSLGEWSSRVARARDSLFASIGIAPTPSATESDGATVGGSAPRGWFVAAKSGKGAAESAGGDGAGGASPFPASPSASSASSAFPSAPGIPGAALPRPSLLMRLFAWIAGDSAINAAHEARGAASGGAASGRLASALRAAAARLTPAARAAADAAAPLAALAAQAARAALAALLVAIVAFVRAFRLARGLLSAALALLGDASSASAASRWVLGGKLALLGAAALGAAAALAWATAAAFRALCCRGTRRAHRAD
jgi:hypothetical protein